MTEPEVAELPYIIIEAEDKYDLPGILRELKDPPSSLVIVIPPQICKTGPDIVYIADIAFQFGWELRSLKITGFVEYDDVYKTEREDYTILCYWGPKFVFYAGTPLQKSCSNSQKNLKEVITNTVNAAVRKTADHLEENIKLRIFETLQLNELIPSTVSFENYLYLEATKRNTYEHFASKRHALYVDTNNTSSTCCIS